MSKIGYLLALALFCVLAIQRVGAAPPGKRVVVYDNVATEVAAPPAAFAPTTNAQDLWVTLKDLTRATKFTLKPQGVCRDQLCFPIPKGRKAAFLHKQGAVTWFNLSEFARLARQPEAFDATLAVWYFGPRGEEQNSFVSSLQAPDFTLPDVNGKLHSLREFRGKKVLLLTWASW